jgi:hypothetical protein
MLESLRPTIYGGGVQNRGAPLPEKFFRRESPTQTPEDAKIQVQTGEIWGKEARGSAILSVKAYVGILSGRGIQFTTETPPHPNQSPLEARWYYPDTLGVMLRQKDGQDYAAISALIENLQP